MLNSFSEDFKAKLKALSEEYPEELDMTAMRRTRSLIREWALEAKQSHDKKALPQGVHGTDHIELFRTRSNSATDVARLLDHKIRRYRKKKKV